MKKKSLLILPVLLLALAACNKEEEEEEPEDNTPTVTEPGDQGGDQGGDGGDQGGDDGEKEEDIGARITFTLEEVEGNSATLNPKFQNSSELVATSEKNENGDIVYTLTGAAATMTADQATDFWSGHAAEGDKYIILTISFNAGETVSWVSSAGDTRTRDINDYPGGEMVVITRISGKDVSAGILTTGKATYTITDTATETSVNHTVDFSALIDTIKITLSTESIDEGNNGTLDEPFENPSDLVIASVEESTGECGNTVYTYHLAGTAGEMTEIQANDFWSGVAATGDKYIILTVSFATDETVSWVSSAGDTRSRSISDYSECSFDVVIRISGTDVSSEIQSGTTTYTITDRESNSVYHVIDFSALLDSGDTGNDEP